MLGILQWGVRATPDVWRGSPGRYCELRGEVTSQTWQQGAGDRR